MTVTESTAQKPDELRALEQDLRRLTGVGPYTGEQRWFVINVECLERLRDLAEMGMHQPLPPRGGSRRAHKPKADA